MNSNETFTLRYDIPVNRSQLIRLLNISKRVQEYHYIRQLTTDWLNIYPGDLELSQILAESLVMEQNPSHALPILEEICLLDPEYLAAQQLLLATREKLGLEIADVKTVVGILADSEVNNLPEWGNLLKKARLILSAGNLDGVEEIINQVLSFDPLTPLPSIYLIRLKYLNRELDAVRNLTEFNLNRFPECLVLKLYKAEALIDSGSETKAVSLLHQCVSKDCLGQTAKRVWGENNPYRSLWPENLNMKINIPMPASISAELGLNQLAQGDLSSQSQTSVEDKYPAQNIPPNRNNVRVINVNRDVKSDQNLNINQPSSLPVNPQQKLESAYDVRKEFEKLSEKINQPGVSSQDGRFPIYVIFTTHAGLEKAYSTQVIKSIDEEMRKLVEAVRKLEGWGSILFYADDPNNITSYGINPADANDPWKLKLSLTDLDAALKKRGEKIGALLIVGGPRIVPFHKLPNPTDDNDAEVPSDNPYSTLDQNYFVPEWPVGRIPDGMAPDGELLISVLQKMIAHHSKTNGQTSSIFQVNIFTYIIEKFLSIFFSRNDFDQNSALGYTAAIWKEAAQAVYRQIGDECSIFVSPPLNVEEIKVNNTFSPKKLDYFNLHGLQDGPEWYGQKGYNDQSNGPDYPIALRPEDIHLGTYQVVFSEACYGAYIDGKSINQSIAQKMLQTGTMAFVGSTCTSYGSVTTPLIAADLLGFYFWKYLQEGFTAGQALQYSKIYLAREMNEKQGYIDGEDQKTLISFVFYGDPLLSVFKSKTNAKSPQVMGSFENTPAICDSIEENTLPSDYSTQAMIMVKQAVERYLPGLHDAELHITRQHSLKNESLKISNFPVSRKQSGKSPENIVVTLRKEVNWLSHKHRHFARLTIDATGKVIKIAASR
jgi:hypothetical protein